MYTEYFGIDENPFSIAPDPRFLYMSRRHQEALAHLLYGVGEGGGFVLLTGEVGTGKTTICRCLMEQLPETVDLALNLNPRMNAFELLASICDELGIEYPEDNTSQKLFVDLLNRHLLDAHARGRRSVLVIDEAQNLSPEVLEQVRLLTNLETTKTKLLQIILIGQPELNELLGRNDMRQIAQRVTARFHLDPLDKEETKAYIRHRLAVVGLEANVFNASAIAEVFKRSRGVPRLINNVCDRSLLGAYTQSKKTIDAKMVRAAAKEVMGVDKPASRSSARPFLPWATAAAAFAAGIALVLADPLDMGWKDKLAGPQAMVESVVEAILDAPGNATMDSTMAAEAGQVTVTDAGSESIDETSSVEIPGMMEEKTTAMAPPETAGEEAGIAPEPAEAASPPADVPIIVTELVAEAPEMKVVMDSGAPMDVREPEEPSFSLAVQENPLTVKELPATAVETATLETASAPETETPGAAAPVQQANLPDAGVDAGAPITPDTFFTHPLVTGDLESALVSLFQRWRRNYLTIDGFAPCARAQNSGLRCLQGQGTWFSLYYLNRPALITLISPQGKRIHTVVTAHTGSTVTLDLGDRQVVAETDRISPFWNGDFLMLWNPPSIYRREISEGHSGRDVVWVKNQLAEFRGQPIDDAPEAEFDEELRRQIVEFQGERLLKKDGIVGVRTMIHLNTVARDSRVPLLWSDTP